MSQTDEDRRFQTTQDQEEVLEEQGLPDGEEDYDPQTADQRKMLAVVVDFSYLIALFVGLIVIAILVAAG